MFDAAQVLALLTARKTFDGAVWHAWDAAGNEIPDPNGYLTKGVLGALLLGANTGITNPMQPATAIGSGGGAVARRYHAVKAVRQRTKKQKQHDFLLVHLL